MTTKALRLTTVSAAAFFILGMSVACTNNYRQDEPQDGKVQSGTPSTPSRSDSGGGIFSRRSGYELQAGTSVSARLVDTVDSETASVGQNVTATVISPVSVDGHLVIPAGSTAHGEVTKVLAAKRFGGKAEVVVDFADVETPDGVRVPVEGSMSEVAKSERGKDTAIIAGSAVGGAILGKVIGGGDGEAAAGAVVGGGVGTAVASRRGDEAVLEAGREVVLRVKSTVEVAAAKS